MPINLLQTAKARITRLVHGNVIPMGIPWERSHGMGWDSTHLYFLLDSEIEWECQTVTELSYLDYTSEFQSQ